MLGFATVVLPGISLALWNQRCIARRESFIRNDELPRGLFDNRASDGFAYALDCTTATVTHDDDGARPRQ